MGMSQQIVVTGIILPDEWDENGKVIKIAIFTDSEEVYGLERNTTSRALMSFTYKNVKLTGKLKRHPDGNKSIIPIDYSVSD
jgi:hypothetical protein